MTVQSDVTSAEVFERIEQFRRRSHRLRDEHITLAHGAGGKASATLIESVFLPAFGGGSLAEQADAAVLRAPAGQSLAFTTDAYVVTPAQFPGGSIGDLAVNGTINDLAMVGARPIGLSLAFVLEEGLPVAMLREIVADAAAASAAAGVPIVTGDTKVVERGACDGLFITSSGIGTVPNGRRLDVHRVTDGDAVLVSGPIAEHGVAITVARGDLAIDADVRSDTAALHRLVDRLLDAAPATRWLRDATRGGVATVCNELAQASGTAVVLQERLIPVKPVVAGACELLGIDPLYVANEGRLIAVVPAEEAGAALVAMRGDPAGAGATCIGEIRAAPAGVVVLVTPFGGTRIVDMLVGDPLPRIC
jgi:hydrogenase expression/formation protein HypE